MRCLATEFAEWFASKTGGTKPYTSTCTSSQSMTSIPVRASPSLPTSLPFQVDGLHLTPVNHSKIAAASATGICATSSAAASCNAGEAVAVSPPPNLKAGLDGKRHCLQSAHQPRVRRTFTDPTANLCWLWRTMLHVGLRSKSVLAIKQGWHVCFMFFFDICRTEGWLGTTVQPT